MSVLAYFRPGVIHKYRMRLPTVVDVYVALYKYMLNVSEISAILHLHIMCIQLSLHVSTLSLLANVADLVGYKCANLKCKADIQEANNYLF